MPPPLGGISFPKRSASSPDVSLIAHAGITPRCRPADLYQKPPNTAPGPLHPQHPLESTQGVFGSTLLTHRPRFTPSPTPSESIPGAQKQKNALNCNFFAIRDCCELSNHGSRRKSAGNQPISCPFPLCSDKRESAIAKKLHEYRDFCFHGGKIAVTEQILKRDTAKKERQPLWRVQKTKNPHGRQRQT